MKRFIIIIFLLLGFVGSFAQKKYKKEYLDKDFKFTTKEKAEFYRLIQYDKFGKPKGLVRDYYAKNGRLQFAGYLLSTNPDVLSGEAFWYNEDGSIAEKGVFFNGYKEGVFSVYNNFNGKSYLSQTIQYKRDVENGVIVEYSPSLDTIAFYHMKDGLKDGNYYCVEYDCTRYVNYINGKEEGLEFRIYKDLNKIKRTFYSNGLKQGLEITQILNSKNKTDTLLLSKFNYENNNLEGEQFSYSYPYGNVVVEHSYYKNGKLNGEQTTSIIDTLKDSTFILKKANYIEGKEEGKSFHYNLDMSSKRIETYSECEYHNGLDDGEQKFYYYDNLTKKLVLVESLCYLNHTLNGPQIRNKGWFALTGLCDGVDYIYRKTYVKGLLKDSIYFENGKAVSANYIFDSQGKLIVKEFVRNGLVYSVVGNEAAIVCPLRYQRISNLNCSVYSDSIIIPDMIEYEGKTYKVTIIEDGAFQGGNLKYLFIPATIRYIYEDAFDFVNFEDIVVDENNTYYSIKNKMLFNDFLNQVICEPNRRKNK